MLVEFFIVYRMKKDTEKMNIIDPETDPQKTELYNEPSIFPLFPTPVVKININRDFTKEELQFFLTKPPMWKDPKIGMSNHRSKDLYLFNNEELKDIKKFCEDELELYLKEIEGADIDHVSVRITQSWLNQTNPQEYQPLHYHLNSYLSGVLYIKCLPNDNINFHNRMYGLFNNIDLKKKNTIWNRETNRIGVKEGDLIIFPSWMTHFVDTNETDKERFTLAFNTFPTGEMGDYVEITQLKI